MNRITLPLLTLALSLAPILGWSAEPNADQAKVVGAMSKSLDEPTTVDFNAVPLNRAIKEIERRQQITIRVDNKALAAIYEQADMPVTLHVAGITLRSVLNLLIRSADPFNLDWTVRDGSILVTTRGQAEAEEVTRRHDVLDLVAKGPNASRDTRESDFDDLVILTESVIEPATWPDGTGPGPLRLTPDRGGLVFEQMPRVHDECEELFVALRQAIRERAEMVRVGPPTKLRNEERVRKVLEEKTVLDVARTPLCDVLAMLAKRHGIPVVVDQCALDASRIKTAAPVSLQAANISLKAALKLLLEPLGLVAVVQHEVVLVTLRENTPLEVVIYRTGDLMSKGKKEHEAIQSLIEKTAEKHDNASCALFRKDSLLVCLETAESQERIRAQLAQMRKNPNLDGHPPTPPAR
ncbi:MAG: hypothetical protein ACLP9L_17145 [Thermoguttaceae bacterium]